MLFWILTIVRKSTNFHFGGNGETAIGKTLRSCLVIWTIASGFDLPAWIRERLTASLYRMSWVAARGWPVHAPERIRAAMFTGRFPLGA